MDGEGRVRGEEVLIRWQIKQKSDQAGDTVAYIKSLSQQQWEVLSKNVMWLKMWCYKFTFHHSPSVVKHFKHALIQDLPLP